jgi:hypothetical protein
MIGFQINGFFLDFSKTDFKCPHCNKEYNDNNGKYLNRCNKNKSFCTKISCSCGKSFHMTYDYMSEAISFIN